MKTMKNLLMVLCLMVSTYTFADAWDNLTKEQANAVVAELKANPYIFDYCDCCDYEGEYATSVFLLKVIAADIVTCSWDENYYSVKVTTETIAQVNYTATGLDTKKLMKPGVQPENTVIYMNYTWTINPSTKKASPFFNKVEYTTYGTDNKPCKSEFNFPTPKAVAKVSRDKDYGKWYKKNVK